MRRVFAPMIGGGSAAHSNVMAAQAAISGNSGCADRSDVETRDRTR
jgi:hypothetical protein